MARRCQSFLKSLRHCPCPPSLEPIGSPTQLEFACIEWTQTVTNAVFAPTQICRPPSSWDDAQNPRNSTTTLGFGSLASCKPGVGGGAIACVGVWALFHSRAAPPPAKFHTFKPHANGGATTTAPKKNSRNVVSGIPSPPPQTFEASV